MPNQPDPGADLDRAAAKTARKAAWKREKTAKERKDAKAARIAAWEESTHLKWGER